MAVDLEPCLFYHPSDAYSLNFAEASFKILTLQLPQSHIEDSSAIREYEYPNYLPAHETPAKGVFLSAKGQKIKKLQQYFKSAFKNLLLY